MRIAILLILATAAIAEPIWITRDGTNKRQIERAEWQASALPAKGWSVTSAPPPEPTESEKRAAAIPEEIARVRAQIIAAITERRALEAFDDAPDKPFAVAAERAAITARIAALKADLAELKAKR